MKKYKLNKSLVLTENELTALNELPKNLPETKLNKKQIDLVNAIYYKYIAHKIVKGWGKELFEIEQAEKWPSGPRLKRHEAMRIILNNLVELNTYRKDLTPIQAAKKFHSALSCRESYQILISKAYSI